MSKTLATARAVDDSDVAPRIASSAVGPGAMIHGCHSGAATVVEPGAIVCDGSVVGAGCVVRAGAVVKQRSRFGAAVDIDGFPATEVGRIDESGRPAWALHIDDLPSPTPGGERR